MKHLIIFMSLCTLGYSFSLGKFDLLEDAVSKDLVQQFNILPQPLQNVVGLELLSGHLTTAIKLIFNGISLLKGGPLGGLPLNGLPVGNLLENLPLNGLPVGNLLDNLPLNDLPVGNVLENLPLNDLPVGNLVENLPLNDLPVGNLLENSPLDNLPVGDLAGNLPVNALAGGLPTGLLGLKRDLKRGLLDTPHLGVLENIPLVQGQIDVPLLNGLLGNLPVSDVTGGLPTGLLGLKRGLKRGILDTPQLSVLEDIPIAQGDLEIPLLNNAEGRVDVIIPSEGGFFVRIPRLVRQEKRWVSIRAKYSPVNSPDKVVDVKLDFGNRDKVFVGGLTPGADYVVTLRIKTDSGSMIPLGPVKIRIQ